MAVKEDAQRCQMKYKRLNAIHNETREQRQQKHSLTSHLQTYAHL